MATDSTPRYRRLKSTGGNVFWHPCAVCGDINAPYGYGVERVSCGVWIDELDYLNHKTGKKIWKGSDPKVKHGEWFCSKHRPNNCRLTGATT